MSVGYAADKNAIDSRAGQLALSARNLFEEIGNFNAFLSALTTPQLVALGYSDGTAEGSTDEVSILKSAFSQLDVLRQIATNQAAGAQNDYLFFAKQLIGPN